MPVIGLFELVLDDDDRIIGLIAAYEIQAEVADRVLGAVQDEVHAKEVVEHIDVAQQPGREVQRFVFPDFTRRDNGEPSERFKVTCNSVHQTLP
jgi:hypothetical protein